MNMRRTHAGHGSIGPDETCASRASDQSTLTPERIAELRELLEKATPGPWSTHLVDDTTIISPTREVATTCDSVQAEREDGYNIEYEQMEADAALIVAMRNAIPDLLDAAERTDSMVDEIDMLRDSEARWIGRLAVVRHVTGDNGRMMLDEFAARFDARWKSLIETESRASRAREDALREAIEICKEADAQDDRDNGAAATGAACNAANAILALIDKPKGGARG